MVLNHIAKIITPTDLHGQTPCGRNQSGTTAKIKKSKKIAQKFAGITKSVTFATLSIFYNKLHLLNYGTF